MRIIFSRVFEYALQAVSYLAIQPAGKNITINDLTKRLNIPYHFLAKILQNLTYKKLLVLKKGLPEIRPCIAAGKNYVIPYCGRHRWAGICAQVRYGISGVLGKKSLCSSYAMGKNAGRIYGWSVKV